MEKATVKNRNTFIDMIRGLGIILVCVGHCIQYGSGAEILNNLDFFHNKIYVIIYSFHMPFLMLISGYLFWKSVQKLETLWQCLKTRFFALIVPIIIWNTLRWILSIVSGRNAYSVSMYLKWIKMLFLEFWFLWAIFWCSLIVFIVYRYFRDNLLIYVAIFFIMMFLPDYMNFEYYKFMYPFFAGAYLFHKDGILDKLREKGWTLKIGIASGIIWIILLQFYNYDSYIYISGFTVLRENPMRQIGIDLFRTIIGFAGSIAVIGIVYLIYCVRITPINSGLACIGRNTIAIYIVSSYINSLVLAKVTAGIDGYHSLYILFETIIIICMCMLFSWCCMKISLLDKLLLGGR